MRRFFLPPESIQGSIARISGPQAHHILHVLRLREEDKLQLFDVQGRVYQGKIVNVERQQLKIEIVPLTHNFPRSKLKIALIQALPKKNKMDIIVEKTTELGVDVIIPTQTARTIVRLDKTKAASRIRRWQRIALEAAQQCGRITIPQLEDLTQWPEVLSSLRDYELKLLFSLDEATRSLKEILQAEKKATRLALVIGPEGDFTPEEVGQAKQKGFILASLGKTTLKSDTAAIAALAIINYELN